jgi:DNA-binding CsgD family transcriptional regulator
MSTIDANARLDRVATFGKIFGGASSLEEVCRLIVQEKEFAGKLHGTQIHSLSRKGNLVSVATFGKESFAETEQLWLFDEHPITACLAKREVVIGAHPDYSNLEIWAMPIMKDKTITGALSSVATKNSGITAFCAEELDAIANMAHLFLSLSGMPEIVKEAEAAATGELTNRQLEIVGMMAKGMTNAEIAKELILSESSIKQESVKIFKSLGVENRRDAVKRAISTGLISEQKF